MPTRGYEPLDGQALSLVHYASTEAVTSTTSQIMTDAFSTTTPSLPAGDYLIACYAELQGGAATAANGRITLDGDADADDLLAGQILVANSDQAAVMGGFRRVTLTLGTHTIAIQYMSNTPAVSVLCRHKRVAVFAIGA